MSYTVKKLAKLSGVTVRTLHHYDEIGLLKPAWHGSNNYRYYEEEQLLLLQQILFYRELGLSLDAIKRVLSSSDFNKMSALKSHRKSLSAGLDRTQQLIKTIDKTIKHLQGKIKMKEEEFFYGLDSPKQKKYEKYLLEKGLTTKGELAKGRKSLENKDLKKWQLELDNLYKEAAEAIEKGISPHSAAGQAFAKRHCQMLQFAGTTDKERLVGLFTLYREHPDFQKFYNRYHPQLIDFLEEAVKLYLKHH